MVRLWLKKPLEKHATHGARPSLRFTEQEWPAGLLELRNAPFLALWNLSSEQSSCWVVPPSVSSGCDLLPKVSLKNQVSWVGLLVQLLLKTPCLLA